VQCFFEGRRREVDSISGRVKNRRKPVASAHKFGAHCLKRGLREILEKGLKGGSRPPDSQDPHGGNKKDFFPEAEARNTQLDPDRESSKSIKKGKGKAYRKIGHRKDLPSPERIGKPQKAKRESPFAWGISHQQREKRYGRGEGDPRFTVSVAPRGGETGTRGVR